MFSSFLCMNDRFEVAVLWRTSRYYEIVSSLSVVYFNMLNNYIAVRVEAWMACTKALPGRDVACQLWTELAFVAYHNFVLLKLVFFLVKVLANEYDDFIRKWKHLPLCMEDVLPGLVQKMYIHICNLWKSFLSWLICILFLDCLLCFLLGQFKHIFSSGKLSLL